MEQEEKLPGEGRVKPRAAGQAAVSQAKARNETKALRQESLAPWHPGDQHGCSTLVTTANHVSACHRMHFLFAYVLTVPAQQSSEVDTIITPP